MWILLKDSFVNVVADKSNPDRLMVTARLRGDIPRLFPKATVKETPDGDYRYRTFLPRSEVAAVIAASITEINYNDLKGVIKESNRYRAYRQVFDPLLEMQQDEML